jgi:hypothetical protein
LEPIAPRFGEDSRNRFETQPKPFFTGREIALRPRPHIPHIIDATHQEIAMTAIAKAFSNVIPAISPDIDILKAVALFCGAGLFVYLLVASYGLDMSVGFF